MIHHKLLTLSTLYRLPLFTSMLLSCFIRHSVATAQTPTTNGQSKTTVGESSNLNVQNKNTYPIDFQNLNPQLIQEIESKFDLKSSLHLDTIDQITKYLMTKGIFESIEVYQENQKYIFKTKLSRKINSIKLSGYDAVSEYDIMQLLQFKVDDRYDEQVIIESATLIKKWYEAKGYFKSSIDVLMPPNSNGHVDIEFKITEGEVTVIDKIEVLSSNSELSRKLENEVDNFLNTSFNESRLNEIQENLKKYLRKKNYLSAQISDPKIDLIKDDSAVKISILVEKAQQYEIDLNQNINLSDSKILKYLDLENYSLTSTEIKTDLTNRIRKLYLEKGFARVQIENEETEVDKKNLIILKFFIEEGPQVKIESVQINGELRSSKKDLISFFNQNSGPTISDGYYNKEDVDTGIKNLGIYLQNQGYLRAKIISNRAIYNDVKNKVTIVINLNEGPLSITQNISFEGNQFFNQGQLTEVISLEQNKPLKLNELDNSIQALKRHYYESGFLEMQLLNEKSNDIIEYDETQTQAKINFKIKEGPQVKVATIIVDGAYFTKEKVILKELEFEKGDVLTPQKIEESKRRLQQLGLFSNIDIRMVEQNTEISERTIVIKIGERDPGLFNLGLGASNERTLTLRGFTGIAYRNIMGTARAASARVDVNYNIADVKFLEHKIAFGYLEPYLFDTRLRGKINISRSQTVTDYDKKEVSEVNQTTYTIEQQLTSNMLLTWDIWSLATVKDFRLDPNDTTATSLQDIATTSPSIELDLRDHPFNPTRGTFSRLSYEYSSPDLGSSDSIKYYKFGAQFTHYTSLKEGWVFANSLRGGYLQNLSEDGGVPYSKKGFILGGRSTVRGFEAGTSERFPNDTDLGSEDYLLTTRATFGLFKSELRFPLYGSFGGALFYDGGAVFIEGLEFDDPYRDAAGFAFRYNTPVGPVNLEFGFKLDKKESRDESAFRFHFSIGTF